ncbi:MAG: hypothetical protein K1X75_10625 [Leptospirales bacterium]|nr:hypothetical protein [Leptospirales bacterium]
MIQHGFRDRMRALIWATLVGLGGCASLPDAEEGAAAEALTDRMLAAIGYQNWTERTAALSFTFDGASRQSYIWDLRRRLVQASWDEIVVRYSLNDFRAEIEEKGAPVSDPAMRAELLAEANKKFVNDSFWFNPLLHVRAPGAHRGLVASAQGPALRVQYSSGGVTPGDAYLFRTDESGRAVEMQLWVSVLPIKGVRATLGGYQTGETGVSFPTENSLSILSIRMLDVHMYASYPPAGQADPFAALAASGR